MGNEDHAYGYQHGIIPSHGLSTPFADRSSCASVPAAIQGETSGNGFYVPLSVAPSNASPDLSLSILFPENHIFPGGSSAMFHDDSQSDPPGLMEFPSLTTGIHTRTSQPHPHGSSISSTVRPQSQTNPSFFPPSTTQFRPATHGPEPQMIPGNQSTYLARRTLPSALPSHPLPAQFASGPLHTNHSSFPGQYMMPLYPPPFQNQPSQPYVYHGHHPLASSPYPPPQYFPLPQREPYHPSDVTSSNLSQQQAHHLPPPMPQPATSNPASYRAGLYPPPLASSTAYFGLPPQYQPNVHQWYYGPGSSAEAINQGAPIHGQQRYPMGYSHPRTQRLPKDSNALRMQSSALERLSSSSLGPNDVTRSRNTHPPATAHPPEQISLQSPPKSETRELSNKLAASISHAHDRPLARRHYHPNPPPNRSEWVMWVGNVPNDTTHDELWQFLKHSAPVASDPENSGGVEDSGVLSVFLISRSNCAFVNYQSEQHLNHAISRFSGRQMRPYDRRCPRLVCRTRRKNDDLRAGVGAQRGIGVHTHHVKNMLQKGKETAVEKSTLPHGRRPNLSTIAYPPPVPSGPRGDEFTQSDTVEGVNPKVPARSPSSYASTSSSFLSRNFPKRFFILKSLTQYDLDLSVERGVWATQKHNEAILDQAFRTSKEVILIFSVNKSGEFYGYARMASGILRSNHGVSWALRADSLRSASSPSSSCLPAHGIPEQGEGAPHQSPQIHPSPSERRLVEGSPFLLAPSSDETQHYPSATSPQVKVAQERQSAPPVLHRDFEDPISPDPPLRPMTSQLTQGPDPPSTPRHASGKNPAVRTRTRNRGGGSGVDDPDNLGMQLQPVMEEVHSGSGIEQDIQPAPTVPSESLEMHGDPEIQQREANWGETFKVDWLCTERVSFHRTRHLRNTWNHGREIKVSRDGTEVEPTVGQQLVDEWPILASEADVGDARRGTRSAGRRVAKSVAMPGPAGESKHVKEEPS